MHLFKSLLLACAVAACAPAAAQSPWSDQALDDLEMVAASASLEGLPEERAALEELARFRHLRDSDPAADAQTEIAADALFASLARSFAQGGADPRRADPDWAIPMSSAPDLAALQDARIAGALPSTLLRPLLPQTSDYARLREELARVRADGGPAAQIASLRASLERWRWLPRNLPSRRLDVRIPQYDLRLIAPGAAASIHKVIVGARDSQTPSFMAEIASVTINPSWEPPSSIAQELLVRFRRDHGAAAREGFEALDAQGVVIAPADIDWNAQPFPYRLRQRPGPSNALGAIRFDMANSFAIRLHDTPNRDLFNRDRRAFSHGCIRVEGPEALAESLISRNDWTQEAIRAAIENGEQQQVALDTAVPVVLLYITATVNEAGDVAYADDVYRRDGPVLAALDGPDVALARQAAAAPLRCPADPSMP